jgi:peptide-methionine (S)-S-oxide reductase
MNGTRNGASTLGLLTRVLVRHGALCVSAAILGSAGGALAFSSSFGPLTTTTTTTKTQSASTAWMATKPSLAASSRSSSSLLLQGSSPRRRSRTSSPLHMNNNNNNNWLQNFFGGGAYNTRIDYTTLDFPGPELAELATTMPTHSPSQPHLELATFAGGCFWGLELAFQRVPGVVYTAAGYTGGIESNPTYDQVCAGNTGHTEAVCVYFDPTATSYERLLELFFERVDPTTVDGQGRDFGRHYRTGVYYHGAEQERLARARFQQLQQQQSNNKNNSYKTKPIASECRAATSFWPAERYHQQYLAKGGRLGTPQSPEKGCTDEIRCYG